ncbi:MAG TPA: MFS transporter, partial [Rhodopila sp.]|nr:MFS transporter [Rhodopila sp.]
MTNVRWRIITLLLIATTINYIDRVNLSYATPTLMKEFGIHPAEMGVVLSAFLWTYFLLQVPMGIALDRLGVRLVYGGAALLWGAATMLTATATGVGSLVGWRILLGAGEAPLAPAGTKVIGVWAADHERGFASAMTVAGVPLGVFIGSPFIGWLLADFGWQ